MNSFRQRWPGHLLTLILILGAASFVNVAAEVGQPFGGFFVNRNYSANTWQVDATTPPWWPGFTQAQLRYEDVLVTLEGRPYGGEARRMFAEARRSGQRSLRLTVQRGGTELDIAVPVTTFTLSNFLDLRLADLISGLGFWLLALAVYRAHPQAPVNRLFACAASLSGMGIWLGISDLFPESNLLSRGLHLAWILLASFLGATILHLAMLFPAPVRRVSLRSLNVIYGLMALVAALFTVSPLLRWQNRSLVLVEQLSTLGNGIIVGALGISVAVYLLRLLYLFWRPWSSRRTRRQAVLLLWGLALALPYVFVLLARAFLGVSPTFFWNGLDSRYLLLAVPLSFAFVILRYETSQNAHPLVLGVFMLTSSALVASGGTWIMRLMEPEWFSVLNLSPFLPLFIAAFLSGWFWSTQSSWKGLFSRLFQWERRGYAAVRQFGQQVVGRADFTRLPDIIASALVARMELERAAVWLWDEARKTYALAGRAGEWPLPPPAELRPDSPLALRPIRLQGELETIPSWLTPLRAWGALEVVAPLWVSGQPVGLLGAGKRWDEEIFDERDLEILDLIAQQAALFLLTALQIEQLRHVPHQVAMAQERERFAIAQELHDTIQQFLGRLPFFLEVSRSAVRADPAEAEALLQRCIADVESAAQTVRQIRNSLAPLQLERSLARPLQMLIDHFRSRADLDVQAVISPEVDAGLGPEARHALYRVVQQALDNVAEHAQARRVTVTVTPQNGRLYFAIADDGAGSTDLQRALAEERGSFGLKSMRARITALGGEFEVQSTPGAGTQVSGWLPLRKEEG